MPTDQRFPGYERPKRGPKTHIKVDVPYKPEALALMGLDRDEFGRPLADIEIKDRIARRAAELADKGVRTVAEMSKRPGLSKEAIEKHRKK